MSETGTSNRNCVEVVFSVVMAFGLPRGCGLFAIGRNARQERFDLPPLRLDRFTLLMGA
jgi:hypothetical protein